MVVEFGTEVGAIGDSLHFRYQPQRDPQLVLDELRAARARADGLDTSLPCRAVDDALALGFVVALVRSATESVRPRAASLPQPATARPI